MSWRPSPMLQGVGGLAALIAVAITPWPAAGDGAPRVAVSASHDAMRITSQFEGETLVVFGAVQDFAASDELVVVVRGPDVPVQVMKRERHAGLWLNSKPAAFERAPSFYAAAAARPLDQIAPPDTRRRLQIGLDTLAFKVTGGAPKVAGQLRAYSDAIVEEKQRLGLYAQDDAGVEYLDDGLFRARVRVPAGAPTGPYDIAVHVFRDGRAAARGQAELKVMKAGVERWVHDFAHERPFLYGMIAVIGALTAGGAAAAAFRRR